MTRTGLSIRTAAALLLSALALAACDSGGATGPTPGTSNATTPAATATGLNPADGYCTALDAAVELDTQIAGYTDDLDIAMSAADANPDAASFAAIQASGAQLVEVATAYGELYATAATFVDEPMVIDALNTIATVNNQFTLAFGQAAVSTNSYTEFNTALLSILGSADLTEALSAAPAAVQLIGTYTATRCS